MTQPKLTAVQRRVLDGFMALAYFNQSPPTLVELAVLLGATENAIRGHLFTLKRKGFLVHRPRKSRGWSTTRAAHALQEDSTVAVDCFEWKPIQEGGGIHG